MEFLVWRQGFCISLDNNTAKLIPSNTAISKKIICPSKYLFSGTLIFLGYSGKKNIWNKTHLTAKGRLRKMLTLQMVSVYTKGHRCRQYASMERPSVINVSRRQMDSEKSNSNVSFWIPTKPLTILPLKVLWTFARLLSVEKGCKGQEHLVT